MDDNTPPLYGKEGVGSGGTAGSNLACLVGERLVTRGLRLGVTESATGGLISQLITSIPGCSRYYLGGVVAYDNLIKISLLKVKDETLRAFGAVSFQVAEEMAAGGLTLLRADVCISDTGLAGPGGEGQQKPMGLFYLGLADGSRVFSCRHVFQGTRRQIRQQAAETALSWLNEYLLAR